MAAQPTELFWVSGTPFPALGRRRGSSARTKRSTLIQLAKYRIKPSNKELGREGWSRAALPSGRGSQPSDMDASEHHLRAMPTKGYHCEPPISTSSADETFCETPCGTPVLSPEKKIRGCGRGPNLSNLYEPRKPDNNAARVEWRRRWP